MLVSRLLAAVFPADGMVVVTGPEQHAATVEAARARLEARLAPGWKSNHPDPREQELDRAALDELVALAREGAALRSVAAQPHAPIDGVGVGGAVHVYVRGHPMGCPICQAIEPGMA